MTVLGQDEPYFFVIIEITFCLKVFILNINPNMSKEIIQNRSLRLQEIALFIKNWRINEGLSQREFSKLANVHVNSIYNLERQRGSNVITLIKCIEAMDNMTLSEFFSEIE